MSAPLTPIEKRLLSMAIINAKECPARHAWESWAIDDMLEPYTQPVGFAPAGSPPESRNIFDAIAKGEKWGTRETTRGEAVEAICKLVSAGYMTFIHDDETPGKVGFLVNVDRW